MRMNIFVGSRKIFFFKNQIKIQNGKYKSTIKRKKEKKIPRQILKFVSLSITGRYDGKNQQ